MINLFVPIEYKKRLKDLTALQLKQVLLKESIDLYLGYEHSINFAVSMRGGIVLRSYASGDDLSKWRSSNFYKIGTVEYFHSIKYIEDVYFLKSTFGVNLTPEEYDKCKAKFLNADHFVKLIGENPYSGCGSLGLYVVKNDYTKNMVEQGKSRQIVLLDSITEKSYVLYTHIKGTNKSWSLYSGSSWNKKDSDLLKIGQIATDFGEEDFAKLVSYQFKQKYEHGRNVLRFNNWLINKSKYDKTLQIFGTETSREESGEGTKGKYEDGDAECQTNDYYSSTVFVQRSKRIGEIRTPKPHSLGEIRRNKSKLPSL